MLRKRSLRRRGGTGLGRKRVKAMLKKPSVKAVKRMVNANLEKKWATNVVNLNPTNAGGGQAFLVNGLVQGDTRLTRSGNRTRLISLRMGMQITPGPTQVTGANVRVIVCYDKQANGAGTALADLFADGTVANQYLSPLNPNTVPSRYKILKDKMYHLDPLVVGTTAAGATTTVFLHEIYTKLRFNLKNRLVKYNDGNAGTVADIISPALFVACFTSTLTAVACAFDWTVRFTDA